MISPLARRTFSSIANERTNTIAFIGLGAMGREMCVNLFTKSSKTSDASQPSNSPVSFVLCDALPEAAAKVAASLKTAQPNANVSVVETPGEAAKRASTIITMLPSSPQVNEVYLGSSGILPAILGMRRSKPEANDTLAIDSTTLDVATARSLSAQLAEKRVSIVDAPVSGGVVGAAAGTLSFMVGGPKEAFDLAHPFLEKMGKNIVHCGDAGTGLAVKICNNLILGIAQVAVAEAMLLGTSLGLSPALLASVINNSTGRCWPSAVNNPIPGALPDGSPPCERDFKGGFASKLMLKDLHLALNAAKEVDVPLILGQQTTNVYEDTVKDQELANRDFSGVIRHIEALRKTKS